MKDDFHIFENLASLGFKERNVTSDGILLVTGVLSAIAEENSFTRKEPQITYSQAVHYIEVHYEVFT